MPPLSFKRYLDPGTGSLLLQYMVATLLTVIILARKRVEKAKQYLTRLFSNERGEN